MPDLSALMPGLPVATGLAGIAIALVTYAGVLALLPGERRATKRLKTISVTPPPPWRAAVRAAPTAAIRSPRPSGKSRPRPRARPR